MKKINKKKSITNERRVREVIENEREKGREKEKQRERERQRERENRKLNFPFFLFRTTSVVLRPTLRLTCLDRLVF